jgi:hypothetical protein
MADDLSGRRGKFNPAARSPSSTDLALKASGEGKHLATYRDTNWYKLGEKIIEVTRRGRSGGGSSMAASPYSPGRLAARAVEAIPKYARLFRGVIGPPDVRDATTKYRRGGSGGAGRKF